MGSKTYKAHGLVLKKTKLGEKDLIVTMLEGSGKLLQGVAKGARKPGGSFASRLEVFSEVDVMMAEGRSLDVVCDARFSGPVSRPPHIEQSSCAAPLAELLCVVSQPDLLQPRVFDISKAAFDRILDPDTPPANALAIASASLWKVMSQVGFRPSLSLCACCSGPVPGAHEREQVVFSARDGGVVCEACPRPADSVPVDVNIVGWCEALIGLRFSEVVASGMDASTAFSVLQLARLWVRTHTGRDLKSLDFLLAAGLF